MYFLRIQHSGISISSTIYAEKTPKLNGYLSISNPGQKCSEEEGKMTSLIPAPDATIEIILGIKRVEKAFQTVLPVLGFYGKNKNTLNYN